MIRLEREVYEYGEDEGMIRINDYAIIHEKDVAPDDVTLLFDFSKIEGEDFRIVGTSARRCV